MLLEILGEIGSAPPWLYRAWGYIFSRNYRETIRIEYSKMLPIFRVVDAVLSVALFLAEIALILYIISLVISNT